MYSFRPRVFAAEHELARDLEALALAAGQRRRRLAEPQIAESHLLHLPERLAELLLVREEADRLVHRELEHVVDVLPVHAHVEHGGLEALAAALVARARTRRP